MEKLRTLIIDDEPLARTRIHDLLLEDCDIDVIGECSDGDEAALAILKKKPDLVFLDVQMPELDGFGVIERVGAENMPVVIFVTAFDQYALRAFEVCALDYLLKPFDDLRFKQTVERAKEQILRHTDDLEQRLLGLLKQIKPTQNYVQRVMVKSNGRLFFLEAEKIDWIKAQGNYACLFVQATSYMLRETISNLETQLDPNQFFRISRSAIVNINRVKELHQMFHGDYKVILLSGTELTLSRRFRDRLPRIVTSSK